MSKNRNRKIINESKPDPRNEIHFLTGSRGDASRSFQRLEPGSQATFTESDYLVIKSSYYTNYEVRSYNGLLLFPNQINNHHPDFKGETVAVYEMKVIEGMRGEGESDGDVVVTRPENPFPAG